MFLPARGFCLLLSLPLHALAQPLASGPPLNPDLVEVIRLDTTIRLDIRYATPDNFMHRRMYSQSRAFLQRPAAQALVRANEFLRRHGYGIVVFDAYRPWSVTKEFWDATPRAQRNFVANPRKGSKHNRGCAADVSLYQLTTGKEVEMPSPYDEFSRRSGADYPGGSKESRRLRALLRRALEAEGFSVDRNEWWHFDYLDWRNYGILDVPFDSIAAPR